MGAIDRGSAPVKIASINADGSGFRDILTDADGIRDIRYLHSSVPEPASWTLLAAGTIAIVILKRRRA